MRSYAATRWCLLVALLLPAVSQAAPPIADWLAEAEAVRSSKPARLAELLVDLDAAVASATPAQREQVSYLHAYGDAYAGRYASALAEARNLVATSRDPGMQMRARALIVTVHGLSRHFAEGLRELEALHAGLAETSDVEIRRLALFASAGLYRQVGQYALAIRDLDNLIETAGPLSERDTCLVTQLREEARQAAGHASGADELQAIIDQCLGAGEPLVANMARFSLARDVALEGRVSTAIAMLRRWLPEMEATRYPRLVTDVHSALARWLADTGDLAGAQRHAMRAVAEAQGDTSLVPLTTAHQVLYEIAEERDDLRSALFHYKRYAEADKAYLNDVKAREFAYQIVRRETQQQNQQIALLDQQNQVLVLRQKVSDQAAQNTRLLIALLLVLLASIAYWAWRVTRRHQSLRLLAEMDSLTGVCNRRHFLLQADQCLQQCARTNDTVALVMFDLDHFKKINDSFGHVTGDWVLEQVTAICRPLCRRVDRFGRLGGEEFAILLPGCDSEAAARVAEQCRVKIASIDTAGSGQSFALAASFGVTDTSQSGYVIGRLLSHADQALYRAKHGGRNMVCIYAGEPVRSKGAPQSVPGFAPQAS